MNYNTREKHKKTRLGTVSVINYKNPTANEAPHRQTAKTSQTTRINLANNGNEKKEGQINENIMLREYERFQKLHVHTPAINKPTKKRVIMRARVLKNTKHETQAGKSRKFMNYKLGIKRLFFGVAIYVEVEILPVRIRCTNFFTLQVILSTFHNVLSQHIVNNERWYSFGKKMLL